MSRRVFVTNIPMHAYAEAWVEVPEGLEGDELNDAVRHAVLTSSFRLEGKPAVGDLDEAAVKSGWEFSLPLE